MVGISLVAASQAFGFVVGPGKHEVSIDLYLIMTFDKLVVYLAIITRISAQLLIFFFFFLHMNDKNVIFFSFQK